MFNEILLRLQKEFSSQTSKLTRREFLHKSTMISTGIAIASCSENSTEPEKIDSPGKLDGNQPSKSVIIIGAGISGLVAGFELKQAGHDVTILEARELVGGRVLTLRTPFSNEYFAEAGASRIPPNHELTLSYANYFELPLEPFYPQIGSFVKYSSGERSFISSAEYLESPPWPGASKRIDYVKIKNGMEKLPLAFAESLSLNIHLASPVESIRQNSDSVDVSISDGTKFSANRVLCTVPVPTIKNISFSPKLSNEKQQAYNGGYYYQSSSRAFVQFSKRFWESEQMNGWGNSDFPEEIWQPTWDQAGLKGIILSYLRGSRATEMDQLSEEAKIDQVLNRWENIFPDVHDHVENSTSHSWDLDKWSNGAYASPSGNQDELFGSHIGKVEGLVHFAGEHASENHGWIQGALVSGLLAAKEIHEAELTKSFS